MEMPDNCQCYCYTIMSSLCFPCQVKVHLLHLTASPHGELIMNTKCPTPKDRTRQSRTDTTDRRQSPQAAGSQAFSQPTDDCTKADCQKCFYYKSFISKLTSGMCEDKILKMVCSNPCLISSELPTVSGSARNGSPSPSPETALPKNGTPATKDTNHRKTSKTSVKSNTSGAKDKQPLTGVMVEETIAVFVRDQAAPSIKNAEGQDKKPTTPPNLMTTDKILKRSFESMAKNRPASLPSRSPSPVSKRPEIKQTTPNDKVKPAKTDASRNNKPVNVKNSSLQKSSPSPSLSRSPKPKGRQTAGREKGSIASGKIKSNDTKAKPISSLVPSKKTSKSPASASEGSYHSEEDRPAQYGNKEGTKRASKEKRTSAANDATKADANAGFFEAARVTEFYQPPQLGSNNACKIPRKPTPLHLENEEETSTPDLGGGIVRSFCESPLKDRARNSPSTKEGRGTEESRRKGEDQKQTTDSSPVHFKNTQEQSGFLPPEPNRVTNKNNKLSKPKLSNNSTRKEVGEDKGRKKSKLSDSKKQTLQRGGKAQAPAQVRNSVDSKEMNKSMKLPNEKPVSEYTASEYAASSCELKYFEKARQREENGQGSGGIGRDPKGAPEGLFNEAEPRRESGSRRNSMNYEEIPPSVCASPGNGTRLSPAGMYRESVRRSISDEKRDGYGDRFPPHGIGVCSLKNEGGTTKPNTQEAIDFALGARRDSHLDPNASPYRRSSKRDDERFDSINQATKDTPRQTDITCTREACEFIPRARHGLEDPVKAPQETKSARRDSMNNVENEENRTKQVGEAGALEGMESTKNAEDILIRTSVYSGQDPGEFIPEPRRGSLCSPPQGSKGDRRNSKNIDKNKYQIESRKTDPYMQETVTGECSSKNIQEPKKRTSVDRGQNPCDFGPITLQYVPERRNSKYTKDNREEKRESRGERESSRGRLSIDEECSYKGDIVAVNVVRKIKEEVVSEFKRNSPENQMPGEPELKKARDTPRKCSWDAADDMQTPQCSTSGASMVDATKVYPQFSEYMNPNSEGYKSRSTGNIVECLSVHEPVPPAKSRSERDSSKWNCGVCPDDKRVYYHTNSDGKCTSMVIGLPQDGSSNPHIRINFNKQVKQEITCYKVDKGEQKYEYRDTWTQCDYDIPGAPSPPGSRPATAQSSNNRVPPKTTARHLQASGQTSGRYAEPPGHQQMYYNRPLMRRSFQ